MSGIVGIVNWDQEPVRSKELEQMVEILHHRGPHGRDIWLEGYSTSMKKIFSSVSKNKRHYLIKQ